MITVEMRCKEHPEYKGQRKPTVECTGCENIYEYIQDLRLDGWEEFEGVEIREVKE